MRPAVLTDPAELRAVHAGLLVPAFPPEELVDADELVRSVAAGTAEVLALRDRGGHLAVAVAEFFPDAGVVLLSYLAARADARSAGHGGRLLDAAIARWTARHDPCLVLAEVEEPGHHAASPGRGDPLARLRFYARRGARRLDLPYVQPALRPGAPRVPHLLLLALHAAPELLRGADAVDGPAVRTFLERLFAAGGEELPADPEAAALFTAAAGESVAAPPLTA
ncbi:N-acetyltransferase [Blastococcus saxobsidens]|uniref:N-acetyltransferase n=1 Tax=Blastococcus saxobsidens TaxID=138336 RepID=A0A6L9W1N9_9ACTN|nr:N-acetyltransferase [Blastococcus saxobsidens]NEK85903.1 N-acetyltransferase [Blastococcus saxobsidens]